MTSLDKDLEDTEGKNMSDKLFYPHIFVYFIELLALIYFDGF